MIFERIWPSAEARLLPIGKLHAPTVAVMAIMSFAMMIVASAGLALATAASVVAGGVENRYVVELPAAARAELPAALEGARSAPGVRSARSIPDSEIRHTLERWLGEASSSSELPVPVLVTLELWPDADPGAIARQVQARAPNARMIAETAELKPLLSSIRSLQWLAISLVVLMGTATAAAIVLAARGALDTHRSTIEIMHGIGATDAQITRLFERKIAVDAIAGAALGAAGSAAVLLLVAGAGAALSGELALTAPLTAGDVLLIALIPVLAVVLAVAVAHWTLIGALRASL